MVNLTNRYLDLAFEKAKINLGSTKSNPSVGCVVEKDGSVISSGYTSIGGRPHAEFNALNKKVNFKNANLYVSLEPCSHFGKTPPCVGLIIKKKIKKVFFPKQDPNLITSGKSFKILKRNGIKVKSNLKVNRFNNFYRSYIINIKKNSPLIDAKIAISKDLFTKNTTTKLITNKNSRNVGNYLRSEYDALITTYKTINDDNPSFDCRIDGLRHKSPDLIIIDRNLKIKKKLKIFEKKLKRKIFLITSSNNQKKIKFLKSKKINVIYFKKLEAKEDFQGLFIFLKKKGHSRIFVESGVKFLSFLIMNNFIHNIYVFVSKNQIKKKGKKSIKGNIRKRLKLNRMVHINLDGDKLFKERLL